MSTIWERLAAPFPPEKLSWRVGSTNTDKTRGLALAYLDSRDVQRRLDEVLGPENWQARYPWSDGKRLCCEIGVRISDPDARRIEWIWKADGAGETDVEAEKGAFSDAFKRAAVKLGIGRYLYDLDSPWVELEPAGRSYKIKASEMPKLRAILGGAQKPAEPRPAPAPTPAPIASPARPATQETSTFGVVSSVTGKPTKTGGTVYEIRFENGDYGSTFDAKVAKRAEESKATGVPVAYKVNLVTKGKYVNRYVDLLETPLPVSAMAPPVDDEGYDELADTP